MSAMRDPSRIVSAKPISNWTQLPFDLETQSYSRSICSNNRTVFVDVFKNICPGPSGQHGQAPTARTGLRPPQTTSGLVRDKVMRIFNRFFSFKSDFQTHERKPSTKYLCSHFDRMLTVSHLKIIVYVLCIQYTMYRKNIYGDLAESKPKANGKRSGCCQMW